jgi:hypothetical protein
MLHTEYIRNGGSWISSITLSLPISIISPFLVACLLLTAATLSAGQQMLPVNVSGQPSEPCGLFSDVRAKPIVVPDFGHTAIRIMPSRQKDLWNTANGYQRTALNLVAYDGKVFGSAGYGDDPGLYLYIPWLSRHLHLSLATTISLFFLTALIASAIFGGWGLIVTLRGWPSRFVGIVGLGALVVIAYRVGDVYIFEFAVPVCLVPWAFRLLGQTRTQKWILGLFLVSAGLILGAAATVRGVAGMPTLAFVLILLATRRGFSGARRRVLASLLLLGVLCPFVFLYRSNRAGASFLVNQAGLESGDLSRHAFWHFAYIGLGFISNPYAPGGVCDDVGKLKVQSIAPDASYLSRRYDDVLRREVFEIAKEVPLLVLFTVAAKLGIVMIVIVLSANLGLLAVFVRPKAISVEISFWVAVSLSVLPVLLLAPASQYLLGIVTFSALYGVFSIDHALQPGGERAARADAERSRQHRELEKLSKQHDDLVATQAQ